VANQKPETVGALRLLLVVAAATLTLALVAASQCRGGDPESIPDSRRLAPTPADSVEVLRTSDGSTLIGRITATSADRIELETDLGTMSILNDRIAEIRRVPRTAIRNGRYWFPDPNPTRLYLFPTGRMLPRGSGYFADYYIFFAAAGYALTDWFTLVGGVSLFPGVDPTEQLYYLAPKVRIASVGDFEAAVAAMVVNIPDFGDDDDTPLVGLIVPVVTYGRSDWGVTLGAGYGFADDEFADKPVVLVGLDKRLTRRTAFVSENWVLPGTDNPVVSYGVRFFGESLSVDLGFFNVISDDAIFPGLPFVAFAFSF
jgi:hypothetical protein